MIPYMAKPRSNIEYQGNVQLSKKTLFTENGPLKKFHLPPPYSHLFKKFYNKVSS